MHSKPNAEMLRFAAEKGFIHEATKQEDGRTGVRSTSLKAVLGTFETLQRLGFRYGAPFLFPIPLPMLALLPSPFLSSSL